ncbi:response regulator transcription factor [Butyrivibrio sp. INlla14]|uniref:response regulator transcription factor n=1 Tax=Butyrivibrio sp. INlla14 TaxID=1520808 RepID=UPI0008765DF4|nr:response regulator transcription factor [Butyrivibrio sp. INlla14]SCY64901.1 DNA-binding response regulator, OmpR family, contains REC and winged-helix (wHTH) domain [Butyrivibrio sp. INlla14]
MYKILMVDDDLEVLEVNKKFFEEKNCKVQICSEASKALEIVEKYKPDCILLDVMMPEIDGFKLCRKMRHVTNVPILFLSGKVSEDDKVEGFEAGGDDYIEKPYSLREVYVRIVANIKRNTQRVSKKSSSMLIILGDFVIDKEKHKLFFQNDEIIISNKEYELILFLAQNINREITFEEIGIKLWGTYIETDRRNVMVNVSRLRKKILDNTGVDNLIETVWSKGYKLVSH